MIGRAYNYLQKGVYSLSHAVMIIGMAFVVILVVVSAADVLARFAFNAPVAGAGEIAQMGLSVVVFTSLAYCGVKKAHVAIDIIITRLRHGVQRIIRTFTRFFSVVILGILAWQLFAYAAKMKEVEQSSVMLEIPAYPFGLISAVGTTLLALVFLLQFLGTLAEVKRL
jgi:TRAP-type C4-dicarboxylate transport system permease small subunit